MLRLSSRFRPRPRRPSSSRQPLSTQLSSRPHSHNGQREPPTQWALVQALALGLSAAALIVPRRQVAKQAAAPTGAAISRAAAAADDAEEEGGSEAEKAEMETRRKQLELGLILGKGGVRPNEGAGAIQSLEGSKDTGASLSAPSRAPQDIAQAPQDHAANAWSLLFFLAALPPSATAATTAAQLKLAASHLVSQCSSSTLSVAEAELYLDAALHLFLLARDHHPLAEHGQHHVTRCVLRALEHLGTRLEGPTAREKRRAFERELMRHLVKLGKRPQDDEQRLQPQEEMVRLALGAAQRAAATTLETEHAVALLSWALVALSKAKSADPPPSEWPHALAKTMLRLLTRTDPSAGDESNSAAAAGHVRRAVLVLLSGDLRSELDLPSLAGQIVLSYLPRSSTFLTPAQIRRIVHLLVLARQSRLAHEILSLIPVEERTKEQLQALTDSSHLPTSDWAYAQLVARGLSSEERTLAARGRALGKQPRSRELYWQARREGVVGWAWKHGSFREAERALQVGRSRGGCELAMRALASSADTRAWSSQRKRKYGQVVLEQDGRRRQPKGPRGWAHVQRVLDTLRRPDQGEQGSQVGMEEESRQVQDEENERQEVGRTILLSAFLRWPEQVPTSQVVRLESEFLAPLPRAAPSTTSTTVTRSNKERRRREWEKVRRARYRVFLNGYRARQAWGEADRLRSRMSEEEQRVRVGEA